MVKQGRNQDRRGPGGAGATSCRALCEREGRLHHQVPSGYGPLLQFFGVPPAGFEPAPPPPEGAAQLALSKALTWSFVCPPPFGDLELGAHSA